jgi:hypothetical protein
VAGLSPRARVIGVTLIALALGCFVVERATRLDRRGHPRARHPRRAHPHFVETVSADHFQRGNLHTHSKLSDGSASLEDMVGWYRTHGYQFLAMTEHDRQIDPDTLAALSGPGFVVIPGEEVTDTWRGRPLHVNALCARQQVDGHRDFDRPEIGLGVMLAQIRAAGGMPLVNHPNFHGSLTADEIARGASGRYLLEIWSGHPEVATDGDGERPSTEVVWDGVLDQGGDAIPVAVDDAHGLPEGPGAQRAQPGKGWVATFGAETTTEAICAALAGGRLYASNGAALADMSVEGDTFRVTASDPGATVTFLGDGGAVLAEVRAASGVYRLTGEEGVVRARVTDPAGHHAWTAAYRTGD